MELALTGGEPTVKLALGKWPPYDATAASDIAQMMHAGELSYYGEEGKVKELEEKFETYHGVPYALATSSGTSALHSAFVALGLQAGDEVIAPTHTFLATVMPIFAAGAIPVLVDCEPTSEGISPARIRAAVTARTKAIVVTHLWGHPVSMDAILEVAREHGLRIVEDCSHAHGSTYKGTAVGTLGDVGCFSLQGKKAVSGGQGGILITRDQDLYERALLFGHFRVRAEQGIFNPDLRRYASTGWGLNYRMHPFSAALASRMMDRLDDVIERRRVRHTRLSAGLLDVPGVQPPTISSDVTMGAWYGYKPRFVPEDLGIPMATYIEALRAEGVQVSKPGSQPLHRADVFSGRPGSSQMPFALSPRTRRAHDVSEFPVAEGISQVSLSLPTFTYEDSDVVDQYIDAFAKVARSAAALRQFARTKVHV